MGAPSKEEVLPPWGLAVAGSAGAIFANTLVYPLDMVKTRLQVQVRKQNSSGEQVLDDHHYRSTIHAITKVIEDEGLQGLYSGMFGSLMGVASTNFAYFYWYSVVRTLYFSYSKISSPPTTAVELSLGAAAGAIAQLFTIPIAVVTTRQQTQRKSERKSLWETTKEIVDSDDGYSGLWRGLKASLVLVVNPAITYGAYQRLRQVFFPNKVNLRPWESFFLGAASKGLATIATQPLIVAKVRLQSKPPPERNGKSFKSFNEVMAYTIEHEGFFSLFNGIEAQLAKGFFVQGLLMMTKERIELLFVLLFRYVRKVRDEKLQKAAEFAAEKAKQVAPLVNK